MFLPKRCSIACNTSCASFGFILNNFLVNENNNHVKNPKSNFLISKRMNYGRKHLFKLLALKVFLNSLDLFNYLLDPSLISFFILEIIVESASLWEGIIITMEALLIRLTNLTKSSFFNRMQPSVSLFPIDPASCVP